MGRFTSFTWHADAESYSHGGDFFFHFTSTVLTWSLPWPLPTTTLFRCPILVSNTLLYSNLNPILARPYRQIGTIDSTGLHLADMGA